MWTSREKNLGISWRGCVQIVIYALLLAMAVLLLLAILAFYLQIRHVTTPYRNRNIGALRRPYQDVTLTTADNLAISGWYVPGTRSEAIILVHGIHANRAFLIPQAEILAEAGYQLLLIDLRGHGRSGAGKMTYGYQEALDVQAAVDYLLALPEVQQVGALGHSLGAAAVVRAAAEDDRIEAIVIQSSYSSLTRAVEESFQNFSLFPKWPFAPLIVTLGEYITGVEVGQVDSTRDLATMPARPVLIIHSVDDNLFPAYHAEEMYRAAQEPKRLWLVEGLGHVNPIIGHEAAYKAEMLSFFADAFAR